MKIIARHPRPLRRLWLTLPPMVALATTSGLAAAREGNVFSLTLSESLMYDDNVFRLSPETDNRSAIGSDRRDEFISSTTIAVDASKQVGRHNFYGELSRNFVLFQEFRRLNYTGENDRLGWSGTFGAENNWDAYFKRTRTQSDFADLQRALSNVLTSDTLGLSMSMRLAKDFVLRPSIYQDEYTNTADEKKNGDGKAHSVSLNLGYRPYTGNVIEAQFRHTDRDYDIGGGFVQNETGVLGTWVPSGTSMLELRAAVLQQDAKSGRNNGNADFRQVVGHASYRWRPTGASLLNFRIFRDISLVNIGSEQDTVARGITASWTWTPLAKVKFDTTYDYRKRTFPQISLRDRTRTAGLTAAYLPTPSFSVQAGIKNERRHADPSLRGYKDQNYSLVLQYSF